MLKAGLQSLVRRFGYEIRRIDVGFEAIDGYVVRHEPRWGAGRPLHAGIRQRLAASEADYAATLRSFFNHRDLFHTIPHEADSANPGMPCWKNSYFSALDAVSLMGFLLERKPSVYLEIGGGNSTRFARHAISRGKLATRITSIDPEPRVEVDALCDRVIRSRVEDCDLELFEELGPGDLLFFDGTHRTLQNSDATAFFLDILPRLKPGVLVHIHDIFWPEDYPASWRERYYSEQYVLGAMLLFKVPAFRVVLPNRFVCQEPVLADVVRELFRSPGGHRDIPFEYPSGIPAVSFWLESGATAAGSR